MGLTDFFEAIQGAVSRAFGAIEKFLLQVQLVGLNIVEIVLFLVFFILLIALLIAPGKVYEYFSDAAKPLRRVLDWMRR